MAAAPLSAGQQKEEIASAAEPDCLSRAALAAYVKARQERLINIWRATPRPAPGAIVFAGSSIIEEGPWEAMLPEYRVLNRGIASDTTIGLRARLDEIISLKPSQVIIYIGGNDFSVLHDTPEAAIKRLSLILDDLLAELPEATIVVNTIFARELEYKENINRFNELLLNVERQRVKVRDFHSLFATPEGTMDSKYSNDSVHLFGEAYQMWINGLRDDLSEHALITQP
jgi:lysophospholipase L1-like esterase